MFLQFIPLYFLYVKDVFFLVGQGLGHCATVTS